MSDLIFHHTGLIVDNIKDSLVHYSAVFGEECISEIYTVRSQKVKVCFVKNGKESYVELVESIDEDSPVNIMLKKKISYYHLAYKVENINNSINHLENLNYKSLGIFNSEAFNGKKCSFLYTPDGHLIELIEV